MTPDERNQYIKFRLESALQTYEAAKVLFDNQFWNSSVNRLYYALFYAVNALLVANEIHTKTHASVKSQFSLHFVKTGKFGIKYGKLLNTLFDWRQRGDYENLFDYDKESVEPLFESVLEMIEKIKSEIKNPK
jgi:uncharacterized protein (UPF0332 family)